MTRKSDKYTLILNFHETFLRIAYKISSNDYYSAKFDAQKSRLTFLHKKLSLICYIQNIAILMYVTQIQTKLTLTVQNSLRRTHRFHFKSDYEFYMTFNEFFTCAYPITLKFPHSYLDYIKNVMRNEH